jgi:hypothetical protein
MMKRIFVFKSFVLISMALLAVPVLFAGAGSVDVDSRISFEVSELGVGRWQYEYTVENVGLMEGIGQFTIYFDYEKYSDLQVTTSGPLAGTWDEKFWNSTPGLGLDGAYDGQAMQFMIGPAMTASGFSVSFNWHGSGVPGSQDFDKLDPVTQATIDSGWTVPEPASMLLLSLGVILCRKKQ